MLRVVVDGQQKPSGDKPHYYYCPIWDDDLETPLVQKIDEVTPDGRNRLSRLGQIAKFCGFEPHPGMQLSVGSTTDPNAKTPIRGADCVSSLELIHGSILVLHPGGAQPAGGAQPRRRGKLLRAMPPAAQSVPTGQSRQ